MADAYTHIACCLDGSAAGDAALAAAIRMRSLGPGKLTLLHVTEPGLAYAGFSIDAGLENLDTVRTWMKNILALAPGADGVLLEGHPASAISDWAKNNGVDLLVAVRHRGRAERILLGSFAQHMTYNAPCAVLLVHPPAPAG